MNHPNSIICISCSQSFSTLNRPRIAKCSHTYCESCLTTLKCCLIDQQPNDFTDDVECLPINTAIMRLIGQQKPQPAHKEMCLLHEKQLDLVCIDDGVGVCTNCALFGQHKNHNIKTIQSVVDECAIMAEQVIVILTEIEEIEGFASVKALDNKIQQSFKDRKEVIAKQIKAKFYKIIDSIRNTQKACLMELDKVIELEKKTIKNILSNTGEEERKKNWIKEAQKLIQAVDKSKAEEATKYLNPNCPESGLIKKGEYLIMELNSFNNSVNDKLKLSLEEIAFEMDCSVFDKLLSNCYKLQKNQEERIELKTERHDDEFLLEFCMEEQYPITPSTIEKQQPILDSASSSMFLDIPELPFEKIGVNVQSFVEKSQRKLVDRSMIKQPLGVSNLDNRKKKKIKIPQKYESVFDDLKNDRLQCADFTNAELGDTTLIQVTQYIKNSHKLRTLKLIRNKLTDESLLALLQACSECRIVSLNLGQNGFTDKVFDILEKIDLKDLKNLTLSQNKLNQRVSKGKILEFKKRGITISI